MGAIAKIIKQTWRLCLALILCFFLRILEILSCVETWTHLVQFQIPSSIDGIYLKFFVPVWIKEMKWYSGTLKKIHLLCLIKEFFNIISKVLLILTSEYLHLGP